MSSRRSFRAVVALGCLLLWTPVLAEDPPIELLAHWRHLDVKYDPGRDGIKGEVVSGYELILHTTEAVKSNARVFTADSPRIRRKDLRVHITSADGKTRELREKDLHWTSMTARGSGVISLDETRSMAVVPGLRRGDRLRFEERHEYRGAHGLPAYSFGGWEVPCERSSFQLTLPADHELQLGWMGPQELRDRVEHTRSERHNQVELKWELADLEAAIVEPWATAEPLHSLVLTPHVRRTRFKLHDDAFAVGESWEQVGRGYLRRIEKFFEIDDDLRGEAMRVAGSGATAHVKISALYEHVQRSCRYLGLFDGLGGIIPEAAPAVARNGYGDCKGLSTLLIAMLRSVGVEAHPVLLRTRDAGPWDASVPNMTQFNHYTVWADDEGEGLWLDPTYDGCPAGLVPSNNTASPVFLLHADGPRLVEIPGERWPAGEVRIAIEGEVDAAGALWARITESSDGNAALMRRGWALGADQEERQEGIEALLGPTALTWTAIAAKVSADDDWSAGLDCVLELRSRRPLPGTQTQWFLPRELAPLPGRTLTGDGPRQGALDLRTRPSRRETWAVRLPPGCVVSADSFDLELPGLRWRSAVRQDGEVLHLRRTIDWADEILPPASVPALSEALDEAYQRERAYLSVGRRTVER